MTYPISEIEGMTAFSATKLKSQGIRTTDALLEAARTVKGRKALAAKTGISEQQLLEWANVSDYMRIPGMGRAKVGLVRAAGVSTVRELAYRNPARLAQSMREANEKKKLVRVLPSGSAGADVLRTLAGRPLPAVMGVLNVTPDSFSDGGAFIAPARALERAQAMIAA